MKKIAYCFIFLLISISAFSYENKPRLAVIITVDGLQNNYLSKFMPSFGNGGIKRIYSKGAYTFSANTSFLNSGKSSHYASFMSGTTPSNHGIIADKFFSLLDNEIVNALTDNRYEGINTTENISPQHMMTTTIADEIKLQNKDSKVYAISLDPNSAIILGGHVADASLWIDNKTGMIATSHFYEKGLPIWAAKMNNENFVESKANSIWTPSLPLTSYNTTPATSSIFGSELTFYSPKSGTNTYEKTTNLKKNPFVNDIIKELAIRALRDEEMGLDNTTDLLCVEFSAKTSFDKNNVCAEIEDMYHRLDQNIKYLLEAIDISVGLDNVIVVFTGYNSDIYSPATLQSNKISSGTFNAKRSMALLNSYLMAIYGQGKWVSAYNARNIYLNRSLIEENNVKMSEIQEYAAQFMLEFSGVHSTISAYQLQYLSTYSNDYISKIKHSHFKNRSGDIIFKLLPGWFEIDEDNNFIGLTSRTQHNIPVFIMGYDIKHSNINIDIIDIIPTICNIIYTPEPNGCSGEKKQIIDNRQ